MYADRHAGRSRFRPASLGASLLINGAVLLGLTYAAPHVVGTHSEPLSIRLIPLPPTPPPDPKPQPHPRSVAREPRIVTPQPPLPPMPLPPIDLRTDFPATPTSLPGLGEGSGPAAQPSPTPTPPLVEASIDPRRAGDFQPTYPPAERRAEHEGRVVVRVLIGVDGRVKQVERIDATSDAFFDVTRARALSAWHFKPATRGDVPVEQWKQFTVSFVLTGD